MTDDPFFSVSFASGQRINLDNQFGQDWYLILRRAWVVTHRWTDAREDLRQRQSAFLPDNSHAWVILAVYALDDPEQAMDEMTLNAENFIGVSGICCLLCQVNYKGTNRYHKCPQKPATAIRDDEIGETL
jgi:hypothetical protein